MKILVTLLLASLLSACATASAMSGGTGRDDLWRQAHHAMRQDSLRVAVAAFQRLAAEHPQSMEGREARFFLGTIYLDPAGGMYDAARARENLEMYVAADSAAERITRRPEARRLLDLSRQLVLPCEQRQGTLRCDPDVVVRTRVEGDTVVVRAPSEQSAEVVRLRRELAEREATIRTLREELQRIRNTLAPRP